MKFRFPRLFSQRLSWQDLDRAFRLCAHTVDLIDEAFIRREDHDARVRDLLDCNNRELERRRAAEREVEHLEREVMRAIARARENQGLAKAVDWVHETMGSFTVLDSITAFVAGFSGRPNPYEGEHRPTVQSAYQAGLAARSKDVALQSAARSVGLPV